MKVVKATKLFRQITLITSLIFALITVGVLCTSDGDCETSNLRATAELVFLLWSLIFVLLLVQVTGLAGCLKEIPRLLFAFYFFVCAVMLFVQMQVWGGHENSCMEDVPVLYWWLITNIVVFYLIVTFGLASWGSYLCDVADAQEEIAKEAVKEYLAARQQKEMHMEINEETPLIHNKLSQY